MNRNTILKMLLNQGKWIELTSPPPLTLTNSLGKDLKDYRIYGNSIQDSTPTPENPVEVQSVGNKTKNLLSDKFSDFLSGGYKYFKLADEAKELRITLVDKDTSVDLSGISAGFTGNGINANDEYNWIVSAGIVQTRGFHYVNTKTNKNVDIDPMMYFSFYPATEATWNTINARWYIQIEEGTTATSYEPYGYKIPIIVNGNETTNIYLDEPLRKVGDYADYIDFANQKVVRNIQEVTFDGSEIWQYSFNTYNNRTRVFTTNYRTIFNKTNNILSNKYLQDTNTSYPDVNGISINSTGSVIIGVDGTEFVDVASYKTWLASNNVKVYAPLLTPTEESITLPNIPSIKGTTIYSIDTNIQPSNMYVKYKGK